MPTREPIASCTFCGMDGHTRKDCRMIVSLQPTAQAGEACNCPQPHWGHSLDCPRNPYTHGKVPTPQVERESDNPRPTYAPRWIKDPDADWVEVVDAPPTPSAGEPNKPGEEPCLCHDPAVPWSDHKPDPASPQLPTPEEVQQAQIDPFDFVEPCEPECSKERHAYHQGQWDMAGRIQLWYKGGE